MYSVFFNATILEILWIIRSKVNQKWIFSQNILIEFLYLYFLEIVGFYYSILKRKKFPSFNIEFSKRHFEVLGCFNLQGELFSMFPSKECTFEK